MADRWDSSVTELVDTFRDALIALIPSMERCHIPWRDHEAYDDWDTIADTLFRTYVLNAISWGLPDPHKSINVLPWNSRKSSYRGLDWIEVLPISVCGEPLALIGFSTKDTPYDTVVAQPLDDHGLRREEVILLPFDGAQFRFRWHHGDDAWTTVERLNVLL